VRMKREANPARGQLSRACAPSQHCRQEQGSFDIAGAGDPA
jgi:hypothetical protein